VELTGAAALDRHDGVVRLVDVRSPLLLLSEDDQEILRLIGWEQGRSAKPRCYWAAG
jgi:hypothetical protein